jgi:cysteinyl-tRNA synthetase
VCRDGVGGGEGEKSHTATMEHQLSSVEQLVSQRVDIRRLREEEENALKEENYEAADQLNKKLEEMTVLSEWDIAGRGLSTVSRKRKISMLC